MKLISKLLSAHISTPQTIGFLVANLAGLFIVMASVQFFFDARPLLKGDESIIKDTYLILSKHITSLHGEESFFTQEETETLSEFNGVERFGTFTPSLYEVSAAVALGNSGARLSTDMFFESVPDEFVDIDKTRWHYKEGSKSVPIVLPKDYLDLYNFGFAKSKDMPMLSERLLSMIAIEITISGNGKSDKYSGYIAGLSERLNTILVPESFMDYANKTYAPGRQRQPSRVIVETDNPGDKRFMEYQESHDIATTGNDGGRAMSFLKTASLCVGATGLLICAISTFLLTLSIYIMIEKNKKTIESLRLIGYRPVQISSYYAALSLKLNLSAALLASIAVPVFRAWYMHEMQQLLSSPAGSAWGNIYPALITGAILFAATQLLDIIIITKRLSEK